MRARCTRALKQQTLILNDYLMKINGFGMSRDVQTPLRRLRKQVLTDSLCILKAFSASCKGLMSHLASLEAGCAVGNAPPLFLWVGRNQEG